jgi:hypothetical protein
MALVSSATRASRALEDLADSIQRTTAVVKRPPSRRSLEAQLAYLIRGGEASELIDALRRALR